MSWVRLDDGFTNHPKIVRLTDQQFRVWVKVLCYCAAAGDPTVDRFTVREVPGLTWNRIKVFFSFGLLDSSAHDPERVYEVHDYEKYLPKDVTNAERQARWRARNGVTKVVTEPLRESLRPRAQARSSRPVEEENRGLSLARPEGQGIGFTIDKDLLRDIR